MAILTKQVQYGKELDDVLAVITALVSDLKAGKSPLEVGADLVPKLADALSGFNQVSDEVKANRLAAIETVALRVSELVDLLLPKVA